MSRKKFIIHYEFSKSLGISIRSIEYESYILYCSNLLYSRYLEIKGASFYASDLGKPQCYIRSSKMLKLRNIMKATSTKDT